MCYFCGFPTVCGIHCPEHVAMTTYYCHTSIVLLPWQHIIMITTYYYHGNILYMYSHVKEYNCIRMISQRAYQKFCTNCYISKTEKHMIMKQIPFFNIISLLANILFPTLYNLFHHYHKPFFWHALNDLIQFTFTSKFSTTERICEKPESVEVARSKIWSTMWIRE